MILSHEILLTPRCSHTNTTEWQKIALNFFYGTSYACKGCGKTFDLQGVESYIKSKSPPALSANRLFDIGSTHWSGIIYPEVPLELKNTDLNIPENVRIVEVTCTANDDGGLKPIYEPPEALNHRRSPLVFRFHPIKYRADSCSKTKIFIAIYWVDNPSQDILSHAYKCYLEQDYNYAVTPLNTYIETIFKEHLGNKSRFHYLTELKKFSSSDINQDALEEIKKQLKKLGEARGEYSHINKENNMHIANNISKWFASVILFKHLLDSQRSRDSGRGTAAILSST